MVISCRNRQYYYYRIFVRGPYYPGNIYIYIYLHSTLCFSCYNIIYTYVLKTVRQTFCLKIHIIYTKKLLNLLKC